MGDDLDETFEALRRALIFSCLASGESVSQQVRVSAARTLHKTLEELVDDSQFWAEMEARVFARHGSPAAEELLQVLDSIIGEELAVILTSAGWRHPPPPPARTLIDTVSKNLRLVAISGPREIANARAAIDLFVRELDSKALDSKPGLVSRWMAKGRVALASLVPLRIKSVKIEAGVKDVVKFGAEFEPDGSRALITSAAFKTAEDAVALETTYTTDDNSRASGFMGADGVAGRLLDATGLPMKVSSALGRRPALPKVSHRGARDLAGLLVWAHEAEPSSAVACRYKEFVVNVLEAESGKLPRGMREYLDDRWDSRNPHRSIIELNETIVALLGDDLRKVIAELGR